MSSIIEDYSYDIFISYRQNDNRYDGWVTEFVDNLKKELEANIKDKVSVYFDINPTDGLLETDSVDKSLVDKLKCLIFIPIISRTYCDPKSFTWQHEFCAFNKLARDDKFGQDIRLSSGNVASRILQVKIHDLDPEDKTLLENELGGVLRSVDFIYKSAGVNRPLRINEDHPQDNLNKTYYRDQINKVANAVKEIISAIKRYDQKGVKVSQESVNSKPEKTKNLKVKFIIGTFLLLALVVLGYFIIPKIFKSSVSIEKSVAVLPFKNLSNDPEQEYFTEGMVDEILDRLFKIGDLKVISRTSSMRYKESQLPLKEIAQELGVSTILEGSVRKSGNDVRITVQLIDAKTDTHLWSQIYDKDLSDIFKVQSDIALRIAEELKTILTPNEKEAIRKEQTKNLEAYKLYLQGRFFWQKRTEVALKKSVEYFEKSVAEDPEYASAYAGLADSYYINTLYGWMPRAEGFPKAKELAFHALELDKNLAEAHTTLGNILSWNDWNWDEARKEMVHAIELNPNYSIAYMSYSELLDIIGQTDEAIVQVKHAIGNDPLNTLLHWSSAIFYYNVGKNKESLEECLKIIEIDPDYFHNIFLHFFFNYIKLGEGLKAVEVMQKYRPDDTETIKEAYSNSGTNGLLNYLIELQLKRPEPFTFVLARCYSLLGKKEELMHWLEKAFEERYISLPRINANPDFDNIRSEPEFQEIIRIMGLSDYQKVK